jgi:HPt (histidine-containing phosphotransfer) domain-containing protein
MPEPSATPPATPPATPEDADSQLAELRDFFRPRLTERVGEILAAWEAMRPTAARAAETSEPDLPRRLHRLAHSLAGAAGTFGFPAVGDAARALERRLERAATPPGSADVSEIELLVAALHRLTATTVV